MVGVYWLANLRNTPTPCGMTRMLRSFEMFSPKNTRMFYKDGWVILDLISQIPKMFYKDV